MFKSNCHTHTKYCDGKNTAEEMILGAIEKGFVSLGFSGHFPMMIDDTWAMSEEGLRSYYYELKGLKEKYKDKIDIVIGAELDSDMIDIKDYDFEYVIASVHQLHGKGKWYSIDYTAPELSKGVEDIFDGDWNKMAKAYFDELADFVIKSDAEVVGHFDLITKFNEAERLFDTDSSEYRLSAIAAVDRILEQKPDAIFEVNTGAMFRCGNKAPYPADFILRYIASRGGRITLTSDSHQIESLDYAYAQAIDYCRECGVRELFYITSHGFESVKI